MPQIVDHSAPWVHALAGLAQSASDTGDAINEQRKLDTYLEAAKQRLAMERSGDLRDQQRHDYMMGRARVEDDQRDAINKLKIRGLEQGVEDNELTLQRRRMFSPVGPNGPRQVVDPYLDTDMEEFRTYGDELLSSISSAPPEDQEIARRTIDDMLGSLRNYALEEEDPRDRSTLRRALGRRMIEQAKVRMTPARRKNAEAVIGQAVSRNSLAGNEAANAALPILLDRLKDPSADPDQVLTQFRNLQMGVAGDAKHLARQQHVYTQLDEMMKMSIGDSQAMLDISDIQQDLMHDLVTPEQALKSARRVMYGDPEDDVSDEEWAAERAIRARREDDDPTKLQADYDFLLKARKSGRQSRRGSVRPLPFSMGPASTDDSQFSGLGSSGPASPQDSQVGGSTAPAAPTDSKFAQGTSAAAEQKPKPMPGLTGIEAEANSYYISLREGGMSHEEARKKTAQWLVEHGKDPLGSPTGEQSGADTSGPAGDPWYSRQPSLR